MLTSSTIHLRALAPGELPNTTAQFGHAAFFALIDSVQPELAQALHNNNGRQPFTVSPLRVSDRARVNGHIRLREGEACSMRFTILDSALFQSFQGAFLASTFSATLRLRQVPFVVEETHTTENADEWTGYTTFEELWARAGQEHTLVLDFNSPTAISFNDGTGKKFELLPTPWRVFDSLCRKWNEFAESALCVPQELRAWVQEHMLVSAYDCHTAMLPFDRFSQKGFMGRVAYELKHEDTQMVRVLNALADFALYAGVGYKTTMGMGQSRRVI